MGESDAIEVHHCGECPFHHTMIDSGGRVFEFCLRATQSISTRDPERPTWCPLERGPVTVRLRAAEHAHGAPQSAEGKA